MTNQPIQQNSRSVGRGLVIAFYALLLTFSCRDKTPETTEGETHFLQICDAQANSCGANMECVCGVCTVGCADTTPCGGAATPAACVSSAEHAAAATCADSLGTAYCDVRCSSDADCTVISGSHLCASGFCRTRAGTCPQSKVVGSEVVMLGDMFVAQSHQITDYLEDLARTAGKLAVDDGFRDYSSVTDNALALVDSYLARQYAQGQSEGTTKVVMLCAGGSDVLGGLCATPPTEDCKTLVDAAAAADQLLTQMASDGVEDVVWYFYPNPTDPVQSAEMEVLRPMLQRVCENSSARCHWVDLRPTFAGHLGEYIRADGMTPTDAGSQATAAAIWAAMQLNCVVQ